ncbi:hypothetical protein [Sphingomonas sp.]|uniref:hypothetical protein n=1 Tax=Sphingomonas sp. TaxID=28214 RepID=UPI00307FC951
MDSPVLRCGGVFSGCEGQDGVQASGYFDAGAVWGSGVVGDGDGFDQAADDREEALCAVARDDRGAEHLHAAAVGFDNVRVKHDRGERGVFRELCLRDREQFFALGDRVLHLIEPGAGGEGVDQALDLGLELFDPGFGLAHTGSHLLPVRGAAIVIGLYRGADRFG